MIEINANTAEQIAEKIANSPEVKKMNDDVIHVLKRKALDEAKRNFTFKALFQIITTECVKAEDETAIRNFFSSVQERFPILNRMRVQINTPSGIRDCQQIVLNNHDNTKSVIVNPLMIALETSKYVSRSEFINDADFIISAYSTHMQPAAISRIGVRHANLEPMDMCAPGSMIFTPDINAITHIMPEASFSNIFSIKAENCDTVLGLGIAKKGTPILAGIMNGMPIECDKDVWFMDIDSSKSFGWPVQFKASDVIVTIGDLARENTDRFIWAMATTKLEELSR